MVLRFKGARLSSFRCVVFFALFLLVVTAVPVFAATPEGGEEGQSLAEIPAPSAEEVAAVEAEQREHAEWLSSPEAQEQRKASRDAYASLSAGEAKSLLVESFPGQLAQLNADPGRVLSELEVEKPLGTYSALVSGEGGETALLNSSVPVESELSGDGVEPVDLTLEESGGAYAPQNPITEVELPGSAEEPVQLEGGVEVELPASADHGAQALGEMNLFYPETATATDTLLAPRAGGVEAFEQLRSPESPERFSFALNLPQGATVRSSESGGAEVIGSSGEKIEEVPPPFATDAQGASVPVTTSLEGHSLVLEVQHRSREVAYPVLLDPLFINATTSFGEWVPSLNSPYEYLLSSSASSLAAISRGSNYEYPAGTHGQWAYAAYGQTSYIAAATFSPNYFLVHSCQTAEPHGYIGLWNPGANRYDALGIYRNQSENSTYGTGWSGGTGTKDAIIGIGTDSKVAIGCAHELYVGGYSIQEEDPEPPTITSVGGTSAGWVKEITVIPHVSDPGLGVKGITLSPEGSSPHTNTQGCSGANGSRCPGSWETSFGGSYFAEGERSASISAYDPLGPDVSSHVSSSYQFTTRLDRQKPEVKLEGEFTEALEEAEEEGEGKRAPALHLPVYNLKIEATDKANEGNPQAEAKARRSGIKNIKVLLDGKELKVPWGAQGCSGPYYSCPMSETFSVPLNEVQGGGVHKLKVIATDQVGNEREQQIEFEYFPATGMKDEYVMQHFPLPDGEGNEADEEEPKRPELAVNVTNGNLVYRQRDVEVTGPSVDLEVERFYNSQLPAQDNTEWGDGWTLDQLPKLELEETETEAPPSKASMVRTSGILESKVGLPTEDGAAQFDKRLQALVTKEPGGYEVADASGESETALSFNEAGKVTELTTPGAATVDYSYVGGDLSEVAVEDPGTAQVDPTTIEEHEDLGPAISHTSDFGILGSEPGQLKAPADVAVGPQGNLFVLDRGNNRVEKFDSSGQLLLKFASSGTANGQLSSPTALALDAAGNIWVADYGNSRLEKFGPEGQYLAKFGSGGTGNGQFWELNGIAVAPDGSIWASDAVSVQHFSSAGAYLGRLPSGAGTGQVKAPQGLAVDSAGNLYVADVGNGRISVFDKEGKFLRNFGSSGTGAGQFQNPTEVAVDSLGEVWVGDNEAGRVQLFDSAGDYIASFGSNGTGTGQFKLNQWMGIAADGAGRIWVSDSGNNRMERWLSSNITSFFHSADFGTLGSEPGQLKSPADVAVDPQGNLFVLDRGNNRVEKFDPEGQLLLKFASSGAANGQLSSPTALALDAAGNIWVADYGNSRLEKFGPEGQYLAKFGSGGTGNGQFWELNGIAVAPDGSIWASDAVSVQHFSSAGAYLGRLPSGAGTGQVKAPQGLAVDSAGNLYVADVGNGRISVFDKEGKFLRSFGSSGTGAGQFQNPTEVAVDSLGEVWVGDSQAGRVQLFDSAGDYIAGFGATGTGTGQFKLDQWMGIAADGAGRIWVSDSGNNRMEEWLGGNYQSSSEPALEGDDPSVEVDVSEGLVDTVEGEEAGTLDYAHSGQLLSAVSGPDGETTYAYDSAGRMTKVTLPNGTYGEIKYDSYGRAEAVTVSVEGGKAKTTTFNYKNEPRRTTVSPEGEPATVYDIAPDGSVLKWWTTQVPPEIENLSGSLYANRETSEAITPGDYELLVQAFSNEGIASIQVVADGNQLVDEKTCEKTAETSCKTVEDPWVTNTGNWPPGILQLEVIVKDSLGKTETSRFWVNIPYTPPPDPEAPEPPTFEEVLRFREEFGLDLDLKGNEVAIDERIFNLIGDWYNPQTPAGEVARATMETWGVPLRPADAAELEYREGYIAQAATAIPNWAESHAPSSYAGYYVDHREGGIIHIGFTSNQTSLLNELREGRALAAPAARISAFAVQPTHTLRELGEIQAAIPAQLVGRPDIAQLLTRSTVDVRNNTVAIGASNAAAVTSYLHEVFGVNTPVAVTYDPRHYVERTAYKGRPIPHPPRRRPLNSSLLDGDLLSGFSAEAFEVGEESWCTLGFGASERLKKKSNGESVSAHFGITAGHCFPIDRPVEREGWEEGKARLREVGTVRRRIFNEPLQDGEAFRLTGGVSVPKAVYLASGRRPQPIKGSEPFVPGSTLCVSGSFWGFNCGLGTQPFVAYEEGGRPVWVVETTAISTEGDSGGPVWDRATNKAVGLIEGGYEATGPTWFTPLEPVTLPDGSIQPGLRTLLDAPGGSAFNIGEAK